MNTELRFRRACLAACLVWLGGPRADAAELALLGEWPGYAVGPVVVAKAEGQRLHLGVLSRVYGGYELSGAQVRDLRLPSAPGPAGLSPWPWGGTVGSDSAVDADANRLVAAGFFEEGAAPTVRLFDRPENGQPRLLGTFRPDSPQERFLVQVVDLAGRYAVVSGVGMGVNVLDVTDPARVVRVRELPHPHTESTRRGLVVSGNHVYHAALAGGTVALLAFPLGDLPGFEPVGDADRKDDQWLQIGGGHAYVPTPFFGLHIFSLEDPAAPQKVRVMAGDYPELFDLHAVRLRGDHLFVAHTAGMVIYDVRQPADPVEVGRYPGGVAALEVVGRYAYLGSSGGVQVVDVEDPTNPRLVALLPSGAEPRDLALDGSQVFCATTDPAIEVVSVAEPRNPIRVASLPTPDGPAEILANAGVLLHGGNRLEDPTWPIHLAAVDTSGVTRKLGSVDGPGRFAGVAGPAGFFYVGSRTSSNADRVGVVDARGPGAPTIRYVPLGRPGKVAHLAADGRLLCALSDPGFELKYTASIFDLTDPASPVWRAALNAPNDLRGFNTRRLAQIHGDRLYFFSVTPPGGVGIEVYSLADPAQPVRLGRIEEPYPLDFAATETNRLWLLSNVELKVLDVSNLANPRVEATFATGRSPLNLNAALLGLETDGTHAYLLHRDLGLWIVGPPALAFSRFDRVSSQLRLEWTPGVRTVLQRNDAAEAGGWRDVDRTPGDGVFLAPTDGAQSFYRLLQR